MTTAMTNSIDPVASDSIDHRHSEEQEASLRAELDACSLELGRLQRAAQTAKIPIVIMVEGWEAAGKGTLINGLTLALDSRGFRVISVLPAEQQEPWYPPLHRFWVTLPEAGRITLYDRSWYTDLWAKRALRGIKRPDLNRDLERIDAFERMLVRGGLLIVKFFLQISREEQSKRLRRLKKHEFTRWRVDQDARQQHRHFERWQKAAEDALLGRSARDAAPFVICPGEDRQRTQLVALRTLNAAISRRLTAPNEQASTGTQDAGNPAIDAVELPSDREQIGAPPLSLVDLTQKLDREEYERLLHELQARLRELQYRIYAKRIGVVVCCEGWDAAGKGGNIRRLVSGLDPRGYDVHPIGAPNSIEQLHHYLWRFWTRIPKAGHLAIFDRTWYGRVLVERIEGFCTEAEWRRAYGEIARFEQDLIRSGLVLVKFWFHIDQDTQLARFRDRESEPEKQWKITPEDWRNRERWSEYETAVNDMLVLNGSDECPYWVVPANDKLFARIFTLRRICEAIERALKQRENS
jgi:polyphosphate:AMP phosphotransferase